jgi:dolichyl-phosphate-mannose--protein O-mannosyl transferase
MTLDWSRVNTNTAIHCKSIAESKILLKLNMERGGEEYCGNTYYESYAPSTCYNFDEDKYWEFSDIEYYNDNDFEVVEFSDLVSGVIEMTQEDIENELGYKIKIIESI